jgi:hypothetical protein
MQILRGCFGEKISYKVQICHPPLLAWVLPTHILLAPKELDLPGTD